ncbi:carbonic anhydrase [Streptomyces sp. NPDC091265]|uniref:carbonic anhydrase n=1 Tax=unclassified Streptomyces TaxID=2593676 RepID=UPI00344B6D47
MQSLIDHARTLPAKIVKQQQDFPTLAHGQRRIALFIACSDSRVMPSLFTGSPAGDLVELRTRGTIVPRYRPHAACGVAASVEFAIKALEAPGLVICGHSHCGAVQGMLRSQSVKSLPLVSRWLTWAGHRARRTCPWQTQTPDQDLTRVAQRHLLTQLHHLRPCPDIRRLTAGRLRVHGWYCTVETGEVLASAHGSREFRPL